VPVVGTARPHGLGRCSTGASARRNNRFRSNLPNGLHLCYRNHFPHRGPAAAAEWRFEDATPEPSSTISPRILGREGERPYVRWVAREGLDISRPIRVPPAHVDSNPGPRRAAKASTSTTTPRASPTTATSARFPRRRISPPSVRSMRIMIPASRRGLEQRLERRAGKRITFEWKAGGICDPAHCLAPHFNGSAGRSVR